MLDGCWMLAGGWEEHGAEEESPVRRCSFTTANERSSSGEERSRREEYTKFLLWSVGRGLAVACVAASWRARALLTHFVVASPVMYVHTVCAV